MMHDHADDVTLFERAAKRLRELGSRDLAGKLGAAVGALTRGKAPAPGSKDPAKCDKCAADVLRVSLSAETGGGATFVEKDVRSVVVIGNRQPTRAWVTHECPRGTVLRGP